MVKKIRKGMSSLAKTAASIVKIAKSQIGNRGKKYNNWYGNPVTADWCGAFVTWVFSKAGASDCFCPKSKNPAYVPNIHEWGKANGRIVKKKNAKAGDIVIFDWYSDGTRDHVGLVQKNCGSTLKCIEGNTGNSDATKSVVAQKVRYMSDVYCIIRPKYPGTPKTTSKKETTKATTKKTATKKEPVKTAAHKVKYKVVPREGMNVRESWSTSSKKVNVIACGSTFTSSKKHGNWVYAPKFNGWVCIKGKKGTYLKKI